MEKKNIFAKWFEPKIGKRDQGKFDITLTLLLQVRRQPIKDAEVLSVNVDNKRYKQLSPSGVETPWQIEGDGKLHIPVPLEAGDHRALVWIKDSDGDEHPFRFPFTIEEPKPVIANYLLMLPVEYIGNDTYAFKVTPFLKEKGQTIPFATDLTIEVLGEDDLPLREVGVGGQDFGAAKDFRIPIPAKGIKFHATANRKNPLVLSTDSGFSVSVLLDRKEETPDIPDAVDFNVSGLNKTTNGYEFCVEMYGPKPQSKLAHGVILFLSPKPTAILDRLENQKISSETDPADRIPESDVHPAGKVFVVKPQSLPFKMPLILKGKGMTKEVTIEAEPEKKPKAADFQFIGEPVFDFTRKSYRVRVQVSQADGSPADDGKLRFGIPARSVIFDGDDRRIRLDRRPDDLVSIPETKNLEIKLEGDPDQCTIPVTLVGANVTHDLELVKPKATKLVVLADTVMGSKVVKPNAAGNWDVVLNPKDDSEEDTPDTVVVASSCIFDCKDNQGSIYSGSNRYQIPVPGGRKPIEITRITTDRQNINFDLKRGGSQQSLEFWR